ncbi:MAG TPA: DciA family protein [Candidatus Omnitrophota bacterium]|nr:DciA family protein [Candidatus Omnitrophota bacterium]
MEEVKDLINDVLSGLIKKQKETDFEHLAKTWEGILGPKLCAHTKITYLTKERIHVNVDNSSALFDLNLRRGSIEKELKKKVNIGSVRFKLGGIK